MEKYRRDGQLANVQRGNDEQKRPRSEPRKDLIKDQAEINYARQNKKERRIKEILSDGGLSGKDTAEEQKIKLTHTLSTEPVGEVMCSPSYSQRHKLNVGRCERDERSK